MSNPTIPLDGVCEALKEKLPKTRGACCFCGQHAKRTILGLKWIGMHDNLPFEVTWLRPMASCPRWSCSAKGAATSGF